MNESLNIGVLGLHGHPNYVLRGVGELGNCDCCQW